MQDGYALVCRFLTSFGTYHGAYPSEGPIVKLRAKSLSLRSCGLHWEVHWTDHDGKMRTNKWSHAKVIVKRRLHIVLVRVLPIGLSEQLDILLQIVDFQHYKKGF